MLYYTQKPLTNKNWEPYNKRFNHFNGYIPDEGILNYEHREPDELLIGRAVKTMDNKKVTVGLVVLNIYTFEVYIVGVESVRNKVLAQRAAMMHNCPYKNLVVPDKFEYSLALADLPKTLMIFDLEEING